MAAQGVLLRREVPVLNLPPPPLENAVHALVRASALCTYAGCTVDSARETVTRGGDTGASIGAEQPVRRGDLLASIAERVQPSKDIREDQAKQ